MRNMAYKCVFSDIDGTIANDNLPITYKDQEAVKKLRTQGHYFSFCTGRNIQETKLVTPHFEYDYLVLNNGAMIVDQNDQVLYRKQIKNEIAKEILKESYQKYPYLNYTFFDGQQTYGYINQKTCILTENGYQEIAGDFLEILDHTQDDIDIVFECLNGLEPANTLIQKALKKGKHVISSNKAVVATYLDTYLELEKEYGGSIQVEACVAGGIPFIDALLKLKRLEPLQGYEGIFNGTSNYILDSMQKNNLDFEDVLKQAQEKGYAEKDPSNDIDGVDVYYKTKISNSLAFNTPIVDIPYYAGIRTIKMLDIKFIKMNNKVLRHLSISRQIGDKIISIIAPCCMDENDFLANVPSNYNAQKILSHSFDTLGYYGQGAGQLPTAQAMVQNALDTLEDKERKIVYAKPKEFDTSLLKETWLIRSDIALENYYPIQKKEANYYWIENQDMSIIKKVKELDKNSFIALWR